MKFDHALDVLEKGKKAYIESTGFYYPDFGGAIETAVVFMKKYGALEDEKVLRSLKILKKKGECMVRRYANCPKNSCYVCNCFVPEDEFEKAVKIVSDALHSL